MIGLGNKYVGRSVKFNVNHKMHKYLSRRQFHPKPTFDAPHIPILRRSFWLFPDV
jgi:hypothetical protein